jgi:hypothetical protein
LEAYVAIIFAGFTWVLPVNALTRSGALLIPLALIIHIAWRLPWTIRWKRLSKIIVTVLLVAAYIMVSGELIIYERREAASEPRRQTEQAPSVATTGVLVPAREPTPPLPPACELKEGEIAVFLGRAFVATNSYPVTVFRMAGESMLSFERRSDGISLDAKIRNDQNQQVVTIVDSRYSVLPNSGYTVINEDGDKSTLVVLTPENKKALYIKYLNPQAVRVAGEFYHEGVKPISIDENLEGPCFSAADACFRADAGRTLFSVGPGGGGAVVRCG